jgi:hypothetical protein
MQIGQSFSTLLSDVSGDIRLDLHVVFQFCVASKTPDARSQHLEDQAKMLPVGTKQFKMTKLLRNVAFACVVAGNALKVFDN